MLECGQGTITFYFTFEICPMVSFEYVSVQSLRLSYTVNKYLSLDHHHNYLLPEVTPFQYRGTLQIVGLYYRISLFSKWPQTFFSHKVKHFGK